MIAAARDSRVAIGVTGNSGCGQSTFCGFLAEMGARVLSLDSAGHRLLGKRYVRDELADVFDDPGLAEMSREEVRLYLAGRVFRNRDELSLLNDTVHRRMRRWAKWCLASWRQAEALPDREVLVMEGALLYELGIARELSVVVLVRCDLTTASGRLYIRDSVERAEVEGRWRSQWPIEKKAALASIVVDNNSSIEKLREHAVTLWRSIAGVTNRGLDDR